MLVEGLAIALVAELLVGMSINRQCNFLSHRTSAQSPRHNAFGICGEAVAAGSPLTFLQI